MRQRHALAAKVVAVYEQPFWQAHGQNGLAECEWLFGSTWPQSPAMEGAVVTGRAAAREALRIGAPV